MKGRVKEGRRGKEGEGERMHRGRNGVEVIGDKKRKEERRQSERRQTEERK